MFIRENHPALLWNSQSNFSTYSYAAITLFGSTFQGYSPLLRKSYEVRTPHFQQISLRIRFDLFRFRSPLLTESLLFSFPPDTKMFYFSGFLFPYGNHVDYWATCGCPIQASRGLRLHATNPSLSQLVTLFFSAQA